MEKIVELSVLFDYYGKLLSDKQYTVIDQYCNEDLSLNEIAEILHVSKQGVSDILNRTEKKLKFYESELQLIKKINDISEKLKEINFLISSSKEKDTRDDFIRVLDIIYEENKSIIENIL